MAMNYLLTHQLNPLSGIPFYKVEEATKVIRSLLGDACQPMEEPIGNSKAGTA